MSGVHNILRNLNRREPVTLVGAFVQDIEEGPIGPATVNYRLLATGEEQKFESGLWVTLGTWLLRGEADDYEFRYAGTGDPPSPNGFNVWVGCETSPENLLELSSVGDKSNAGTVEVRSKASQRIIASASLAQAVVVLPVGP